MITKVQPLAAGNALRLYIDPPAGAVAWRVLRRTADAFTGPDDAGAVRVADLTNDNAVLDIDALVNGTTYHYRAYFRDGAGAWTASETASGTPAATYAGDQPDVQLVVLGRIEAGMAVEVARGALKPATGRIPVVSAPFATVEKITFPCVSVHLDGDAQAHRGIGEDVYGDLQGIGGEWIENIGSLDRVTLNIVATSLNPDERAALRRALKRVMKVNLEVFAAAGISLPELSWRDTEQLTENAAPLYSTGASFTCVAPDAVTETIAPLRDVITTGIGDFPYGS